MQIYNEKEEAGQREIKKVQFGMRRSTSTGKYNGAKTSFQGDKLIKKKKSMMLNGIKGVATSQ